MARKHLMLNPNRNDDRFRVVPVIEQHLAALVTRNELFSGDPGTPTSVSGRAIERTHVDYAEVGFGRQSAQPIVFCPDKSGMRGR